MQYKFYAEYSKLGKIKEAQGANEDFELIIDENSSKLKVTVVPHCEISFSKIYIEKDYSFTNNSRVFANGFQSWTDTREFSPNEAVPGKGFVASTPIGKRFGLQYVGDYTFIPEKQMPGIIHSHSYTYVANGSNIDFFGSLSDKLGYTIFVCDTNNNKIRIYKDLEGVKIGLPYEVFNLYFTEGTYDSVFDSYFNEMGIKPRTNERIFGYTSWYNYYQDINEGVILRDLKSISSCKEINTFQMDDGYQTAVGDWLSIDKKKFPNGIKIIADSIHECNLKAGLWLAPFGAQINSKLAKSHPDWLIKNEKGKPILVGMNWGGFYALDIYNPEVRDYIKKVFDAVLNVWGFDLVKLDFLYAASIIPRKNKSRGEIAYDSIELLRECVGDKKILGCGAQMMPSFGMVDYMRIGADMSLGWKHTFQRKLMHREDVSTPNAILNSVYRRHLNNRAFLCDPDVFLLRSNNIKFTFEQQKLLAKFIKLFGSVLFTSDDIGTYNAQQRECFNDTVNGSPTSIDSIEEINGRVKIEYTDNGKKGTLSFNSVTGEIY